MNNVSLNWLFKMLNNILKYYVYKQILFKTIYGYLKDCMTSTIIYRSMFGK